MALRLHAVGRVLVGLVATSGLVLCAAPPASADLPAPLPEMLPDEVEEPLEPVTDLLPFESGDAEEPGPVAPPPVVRLPRTPSSAPPKAPVPPRTGGSVGAPPADAPSAAAADAADQDVLTEVEYAPLPVEYASIASSEPSDPLRTGGGSALPWVAVAVATTAAIGAGTWQVAELRRRR